MKKLIIVLMMIAMVSFLFVGCVPTTPETPTEPTEPTEPVVAATVAPVLLTVVGIDLTSSSTQYVNATEAAVVVVTGTAPTYSEVKVYVDDVCAGTADVAVTGTFSLTIAEADLGVDGDKVIYATAKEAAIAVSAHSVEYAFVLDQAKPTATTLAATADTAAAADSSLVVGTDPIDTLAATGSLPLAAGTWTIRCLADSAATIGNVVISDGTTSTTYLITSTNDLTLDDIIPGVDMKLIDGFSAGDGCTVTVTTAITERATVTFDEEVTYATASSADITTGNYIWTAWDQSANVSSGTIASAIFANYADKVSYFSALTFGTPEIELARYDTLNCVVNGMTDLAGNTQTVANVLSCTVGKASATSLKP